jgi:L-fucose mutarotase
MVLNHRRRAVTLRAIPARTLPDTPREPDTALVIATGEQRIYANILLTVGVVPPPGGKL